jgi:hypothetical protein
MRRLPAAALSLLLLTAACSDDGGDEEAEATTTTGAEATSTTTDDGTTSTTEAEATTTTVAPAVATTEPPLDEGDGPAIPSDPAEYATALIRAWELGDAPVAEVFATDDAFNQLFAFEGAGAPGVWQLVSCDGAAGSSYCTFNAGGDPTLVVRVLNEVAAQSGADAVIEVTEQG